MASSLAPSRRALLVGSLFSAVALSLTACGSKDASASSAMDKDTIIVGYDNTFVPMGFDDNGETKGFDKDLSDYVAQKIGKTFEFQNIDWEMKEAELSSGKIDAIWNGYTITDERRKKVDASDPYLDNKQIVMVLADSPIQALSDLAGKQLATQGASSAADLIAENTELNDSLQGGGPLFYDTYDKALRDLEIGRADAVAGDSVLLEYYAKQKGGDQFRVLDENFGSEEFVIAVRKGDDKFREALNDALAQAQEDGTLETIRSKWFN
ncbi:amino acid ABC transporter substrate-binding protein [Actinomyces vulturis]|uniref:amino acid ABC transporter substrate-binding protein n=1 Tax=Actinomyces vulturis TaxID=1857645 RepID=UPI00082E9230|nr:amino acid ABC transporter substrate-binding protein [Actinomyces vulturis]